MKGVLLLLLLLLLLLGLHHNIGVFLWVNGEEEGDVKVQCTLSVSPSTPIEIVIKPKWSPLGAERFLHLVDEKPNFFKELYMFRAVRNFLVQFGIPDDALLRKWCRDEIIRDDDMEVSLRNQQGRKFGRGTLSFAGSGPNSRGCQMFISTTDDNPRFGMEKWETPIGYVTPETLSVIDGVYLGYGDLRELRGRGPSAQKIERDGNPYILKHFPLLSHFQECHRVKDDEKSAARKRMGIPPGEVSDEDMLDRVVKEMKAGNPELKRSWEAEEAHINSVKDLDKNDERSVLSQRSVDLDEDVKVNEKAKTEKFKSAKKEKEARERMENL